MEPRTTGHYGPRRTPFCPRRTRRDAENSKGLPGFFCVAARDLWSSRPLLPQIDVLTNFNEPELVDSGEVAAIHFFCASSLSGDGGDCPLVGAQGRHKACPYRSLVGRRRAVTRPEPSVVAAGGFAARCG